MVNSREKVQPIPKSGDWYQFYVLILHKPPTWQIEVLNIVTSLDERVRVAKQRERMEERLKSLRKLYAKLEISEAEYELKKKKLEITLAFLMFLKRMKQ